MLAVSACPPATEETVMEPAEMLNTAKDAITVRRVFGDPVQQDGITLIPGAIIAGGGGGGGGHDQQGQEGEGGGFGIRARPSGAFVITDGQVRWRPAVDVNRVIMIIGAIAVATLLAWARSRSASAAERIRRR
jgi:uncharacterized spore protein YtfJ